MLLEQAVQNRSPRKSSRVKYTRNGQERYLNIQIVPLESEGQVYGTQISFVDATKDVLEAIIDGLTGAYSQSHYEGDLKERAIAEAKRTIITRRGITKQGYLGIIGVDLKGLKQVNDTLGKEEGNKLLKAIAEILRQSVRSTDYVVRVGGDEFYVLCPGADEEGIEIVKKKINDRISSYNSKLGEKLRIYMTSVSGNKDYHSLFEQIGRTLKSQKRRT